MNNPFEYEKISKFLINIVSTIKYNIDTQIYSFNTFNNIYERTLFHYIYMYSIENNSKFYIFKDYFNQIINRRKKMYLLFL